MLYFLFNSYENIPEAVPRPLRTTTTTTTPSPASHCLLPTACCLPPNAHSPMLVAQYLPPNACHPMPAAHGLPPVAYHLPPVAHHITPIAHCLPITHQYQHQHNINSSGGNRNHYRPPTPVTPCPACCPQCEFRLESNQNPGFWAVFYHV